MANECALLLGRHFGVAGTLIKAWTRFISLRRKDGSDEGRSPGDSRGEPRSNVTQECSVDKELGLHRKSITAPARPCYLGHVDGSNRHGLVVNVDANQVNGVAKCGVAAQMPSWPAVRSVRRQPPTWPDFDKPHRARNVRLHDAQNLNQLGGFAIDEFTIFQECRPFATAS